MAHSDEERQNIPWVEYDNKGKTTVYAASDAKPDGAGLTMRTMDCIDCHNRPSHQYQLPDRAMDQAMAGGLISPSLPFARKKGLEILKVNYHIARGGGARRFRRPSSSSTGRAIRRCGRQRQSEVTSSAKQVLAIWDRNIFPDMNVTWGKYPVNIGHTDFPGCFRCHDGGHNAKNGDSITQDCNACHNILSMDEPNPKVLTDLGITESKPAASK